MQGTMGSDLHINELIQGRRYFFRACSGNAKGFGPYKVSSPRSIIPSSWRDIENKEQRFSGRQKVLDELFTAVRLCRPDDASELPDSSSHRRQPKKKTTIKQLFSAASKFQVNYLDTKLYCASLTRIDFPADPSTRHLLGLHPLLRRQNFRHQRGLYSGDRNRRGLSEQLEQRLLLAHEGTSEHAFALELNFHQKSIIRLLVNFFFFLFRARSRVRGTT